MADPLLQVEDLHVRIGSGPRKVHAVRGLSFEIGRGETFSIVGESGCGKSMTSLATMGLLPRTAERSVSRIVLEGQRIDGLSEREMAEIRGRKMAMIFQEPMTALNPVFTIGNQLEEAFLCHGLGSPKKARERAVYLLERVGISAAGDRMRQYPHQLSGGLRQRVMIAMALMCGPSLLVADEPTTALDVTIQTQILALLQDLQAEFDLAVLLITHDLGVVARMADHVAVMYAGEFVETGTAEQVFTHASHPYTRGLIDALPIPGTTKRGTRLAAIPGTVPSMTEEFDGCVFFDRCPRGQPHPCLDGAVKLSGPGDGHSYRCRIPHTEPRIVRESA